MDDSSPFFMVDSVINYADKGLNQILIKIYEKDEADQ